LSAPKIDWGGKNRKRNAASASKTVSILPTVENISPPDLAALIVQDLTKQQPQNYRESMAPSRNYSGRRQNP
jgi:hypothetical protein